VAVVALISSNQGELVVPVSTRDATVDPPHGLKVSGTQPGVKLYLDGKELGELPQEVHELALGPHHVRCAGDLAYAPLEQQIQVQPGKVIELDIKLKVLKGQLSVLPGSIPATQVTVLNGVEHYVLPQLPVENFELSTDHPWTLRATAPGYADYEQPFGFDDGERRKTYTVSFPPPERVSGPLRELDGMDIQTTVARYMGSVKRACWQPALDKRPLDAPTTARIMVTVTVVPNGSVQNTVDTGDAKGYAGLAACVSARVRGWRFPPSSDVTTINIPFVFAAQ
jgi:hypothetical protein